MLERSVGLIPRSTDPSVERERYIPGPVLRQVSAEDEQAHCLLAILVAVDPQPQLRVEETLCPVNPVNRRLQQ